MHINTPADRLSGADNHLPVTMAGRHAPPAPTGRSFEELGLQQRDRPRARAKLQTKGGDNAVF